MTADDRADERKLIQQTAGKKVIHLAVTLQSVLPQLVTIATGTIRRVQ